MVKESENISNYRRKAHVVFLLSNGFAARMMLRSGIASQLTTHDVQVTIISPNADEVYFQQECQQEGVGLHKDPGVTGRAAEMFRLLRPYLLDDVINNPALKTKHRRLREHRPIFGLFIEIVNRTLARQPLFRKLSTFIEILINRSEMIQEMLCTLQPDLLVLPNPFGRIETVYLIHARRLGVPVVCQMLSWDNITTKGTPLLMPDYFISWGPIMTEEMVSIYHFPRNKIYECGVAHFDVYSQKEKLTPRDILLKEMHLPQELPYIFYGMVAELYCPNELEILAWLAEQVQRNAFAKPCSLIIRPHPLTISGSYASDSRNIKRLKSLVGPRVALDIPPVLSEQLAWDLPKQDMYRLASLIDGSSMCINAGSTLCLDSCMLDCPIINISFDGFEELPYEKSARRALDCVHIKKLFALNGVRVACSFSDLEKFFDLYLCDSTIDHDSRVQSAIQECGPQDGCATDRVVNTLLQLTYQNTS